MDKTLHFQRKGCRFNPGSRPKIPHVMWHGQKVKIGSLNLKKECNYGTFKLIPLFSLLWLMI